MKSVILRRAGKILHRLLVSEDDPNAVARKLYNKCSDLIDVLNNILLLNAFDPTYTPYYVARASYIDYNNILTYEELKDFINKLKEREDEENLKSDIYIAFNKAVTKYMSFAKPKSDPVLFIVKYTMLNFKDMLKKYYHQLQKLELEIPLNEEDYCYEGYMESSFDDIFNLQNNLIYGVEFNGDISFRWIIKLREFGITARDQVASYLGLTVREYRYLMQRNSKYFNQYAELLGELNERERTREAPN